MRPMKSSRHHQPIQPTPPARPSFIEIYMQLAHTIAQRSTCSRRQVGVVIASADYKQVYSLGYNGNYKRGPNRCDGRDAGDCGCLHGEINAIINCGEAGSRPKKVFATCAPCKMCAKALVNLGGVEELYYGEEYRCHQGLEILADVGITTQVVKLPGRGQ